MSMQMSSTMPTGTPATSAMSMPMATSMVMDMTFHNARNTPLFSESWTPTTLTAYAFTCIFLIALSVCLRFLYAIKSSTERRWAHKNARRGFIVVQPDSDESTTKRPYQDEDRNRKGDIGGNAALMVPGGTAADIAIVPQPGAANPWRWSVDLPRALLYTVIVGIGYLEMLAVMTMNVGYFLSVLGGAFLGELLVGRYAQHLDTHH